MVLDRIHVQELGSGPVGHDQAVSNGAVMVGGIESADMQSSVATGGNDRGYGFNSEVFFGFVGVIQSSSCSLILAVHDELNNGHEFQGSDHIRMILNYNNLLFMLMMIFPQFHQTFTY